MSSRFDLIIRGGSVVTPAGIARMDVGIAGGRFVRTATTIAESATEEIDASGLHVFPGILDAHLHFNEPGRTEWEGLATGSAALAAGGGAWFCDMPLNSTPPVIDAAAFAAKAALAAEKSVTDFSIWGGLVPGNVDRLAELADAGVLGLKAFMCGSGIEDFPGTTDAATLRQGMQRAAALGLLVAVHAEDDAMANQLTVAARARGATDVRSWLATRPIAVEVAAIKLAVELAGETRCALHVVHVSSPEGLAVIAEARRRGVNVSAETCPHYLLLNEEDMVRQGAPAKCAPPLRPEASRQALWQALSAGLVDTIGSDHSPAPPAMKEAKDFFAIWGGISGVQHGFPLLLSAAVETLSAERALPLMSALLADHVARRFRLPAKGRIAEGNDADFALLDFRARRTLDNAELLYRYRQGPYHGRACRCDVTQTWVRGRRVWADGRIAPGARRGHLLKPNSAVMPELFGHTRARVAARHALLTPHNHVGSVVPGFTGATVVVLINEAMGAKFAQVQVTFQAGGQAVLPAGTSQTFGYLHRGAAAVTISGKKTAAGAGWYFFAPAGAAWSLTEVAPDTQVTLFQKTYVPLAGTPAPAAIVADAARVVGTAFLGDPAANLQVLLPDAPAFDMAVNIFAYQPGGHLPFVEVHVMEHGLVMLGGKGVYRLEDSWYPVEQGDVIWMGPYCPQWFVAMGKEPARYLYYKDVNRSAL